MFFKAYYEKYDSSRLGPYEMTTFGDIAILAPNGNYDCFLRRYAEITFNRKINKFPNFGLYETGLTLHQSIDFSSHIKFYKVFYIED